jgi:formate-dependent nitrite reductase cytochrome c552 subunit
MSDDEAGDLQATIARLDAALANIRQTRTEIEAARSECEAEAMAWDAGPRPEDLPSAWRMIDFIQMQLDLATARYALSMHEIERINVHVHMLINRVGKLDPENPPPPEFRQITPSDN